MPRFRNAPTPGEGSENLSAISSSAKSILARKQRRSKNRKRARLALARAYERLRNRRRNFCHHVSKWLVGNYDLIAFERLNIARMARGSFAKSVLDAAWGELARQIAYKAEGAGRWAVPVLTT
jgi:putative transposase